MSFAEDVKNELCQYKNEDSLSAKVEASCLLRMGGSLCWAVRGVWEFGWLRQIMR